MLCIWYTYIYICFVYTCILGCCWNTWDVSHFGSCPRLLSYVSWSGMPTRGIGRSKSWRMRVPRGSGAPGTTAVVDRQLLGCWSPLGHRGGRCEDWVGTKPSICWKRDELLPWSQGLLSSTWCRGCYNFAADCDKKADPLSNQGRTGPIPYWSCDKKLRRLLSRQTSTRLQLRIWTGKLQARVLLQFFLVRNIGIG